MKIFQWTLASSLLLATMETVPAFMVGTTTTSSKSRLAMADSQQQQAMEAAMAASKEFGPTSQQAQAAWEVVEELQFGADNRYVRVGPRMRSRDYCHATEDLDG